MAKSMKLMEIEMKKKSQPDKVIIDHYILTPQMIILQLQDKVDKSKK